MSNWYCTGIICVVMLLIVGCSSHKHRYDTFQPELYYQQEASPEIREFNNLLSDTFLFATPDLKQGIRVYGHGELTSEQAYNQVQDFLMYGFSKLNAYIGAHKVRRNPKLPGGIRDYMLKYGYVCTRQGYTKMMGAKPYVMRFRQAYPRR